jgi:hypothetical protein
MDQLFDASEAALGFRRLGWLIGVWTAAMRSPMNVL